MSDIFDLKTLDDVPDSLKKKLSVFRFSYNVQELISLFKIKNRLTIDEIIVGCFRKYKKEHDRAWVSCTAYNLCKKGVLKKCNVGEYVLVKKIEDI